MRGYHIVNTVIHAIAGLLVFGLAVDLFRRQMLLRKLDTSSNAPEIAALFAAAILVTHPIQTQSSTCRSPGRMAKSNGSKG